MLRRPDAGTFETRLTFVSVHVGDMCRFSSFSGTEPYWATGAQHRFDAPPVPLGAASPYGVLYAAENPETAFAESVIHDSATFCAGTWVVSRATLRARSFVMFERPGRTRLKLADLTGPALKAIGLNADISSSSDYTVPQLWSRAIHDAFPDCDGIRYVSRQNNTCDCYALYERSDVRRASFAAPTDADIRALCAVFNVTELA